MVLKIVFVIAAIIACVQAGGPAAYSISAPSVDHESVGNTQENTVKGHYGQSSQSDYSSQVQTAHSQSHVQRSSTSNDGGGYAPHYGGHVVAAAAPVAHAYAAPSYAHGYAPAIAHSYAATAPALSIAHAAPAIAVTHSAPAISHGISYAAAPAYASHGYSYGAPSYAQHSYAAPAVSYAHAAPAISYAAAPAVSYAHAAPAVSHSYVSSAPAIKIAAAPAYAAGYYGHGGYAAQNLGYAAHYAAPAPAYTAHYAAPVVKAAVAAPALVHTSFSGHGAHYGY